MTIRMVADFYEVDYAVLGNLLTRYKKEFEIDGVHTICRWNRRIRMD
jgi:hypothetical protein